LQGKLELHHPMMTTPALWVQEPEHPYDRLNGLNFTISANGTDDQVEFKMPRINVTMRKEYI